MVNYEEMYDGMFDGKLRYMAEDIYNRRNELSANITEEEFKENVNLTKQYINYLFYANPDKLVELLSFDAYSLFFKSNKNISPVVCDFGSTDRELVDMVARESDFEQEYSISGRLTKYHVDSSTGNLEDLITYAFWGSLNIQYENKIVGKIKKAYYFSKGGKLSVTVNINGKEYIEEISLLPDTMLSYEVSRVENGEKISIISTDERYLEGVVNAYISQHQDEEIKVLFPQIFKKEYFIDYTVPVRTRE